MCLLGRARVVRLLNRKKNKKRLYLLRSKTTRFSWEHQNSQKPNQTIMAVDGDGACSEHNSDPHIFKNELKTEEDERVQHIQEKSSAPIFSPSHPLSWSYPFQGYQ